MGVFVDLFLGGILIQNIFIFFFPLLPLKKSLNKQKEVSLHGRETDSIFNISYYDFDLSGIFV